MKKIKVLTYNIHKGFRSGNRTYVLKQVKKLLQEIHADLVFLQEIIGHHDKHTEHMDDWPTSSQIEYLADQVWPHTSYGRNSLYSEGHHGNAILSKYPIIFTENEDISFKKMEPRGLLHAAIKFDEQVLHVFCLQFSLLEKDRDKQLHRMCQRIDKMVPEKAAMIIAGDFNDWRQNASDQLISELGTQEVFLAKEGKHAKTFPSWLPVLALDRVYYRNLHCVSAKVLSGRLWKKQSDHLPVVAEFEF